jgi:hypothetical protein
MSRLFRLRRAHAGRQRVFPFLERSRRRQRRFKQVIVLATILVIAGVLAALPRGRYLTTSLADKARQLAHWCLGSPPDRRDVDDEWRRFRLQGVEDTRKEFRGVYSEMDRPLQDLMKYAGNDPETGLLRWGNFTQTLLLPSTIFLPDDTGRSYRLRPLTRAVWLRNIIIQKIPLTFFLVPETPELARAMAGTSAVLVQGAAQTTNSWGLRGPEPDLDAPLRGIVLGDSYMQGLFVADDQTPSERLKRQLAGRLGTRVEVLNTGHLGYSPEQEYFTLREYADRLRPQFVVLSLFANDFGNIEEIMGGGGDWDEARYWLGEIAQYCRTRGLICLTVPVPLERQIFGRRHSGQYPGKLSNILESPGSDYFDPIEDFVNEHLRLMIEGERAGKRPSSGPLFNGHIADGHFSAAGCEVWAAAVGRRLELHLRRARDEKRVTF